MMVRTALSIVAACMLVVAPAIAERREPLPQHDPAHPTLDASSFDALMQSTNRMNKHLRRGALEEFEKSIQRLISDAERAFYGVKDDDGYHDMIVRMFEPFDGMTATEITFELNRQTWASMRERRQRLERGLDSVAKSLSWHRSMGGTRDTDFPPMSRVPGRVAPDLGWIPEQMHLGFHDPERVVSPFLPDAGEWLDELNRAGGFDASLYEAALSEGFHYLSHAVKTEEEGQRFLAEYRLHAACAEPGEVFFPMALLRASPYMREDLTPHNPYNVYAPLLIERPLYIGDPVMAVYPRSVHDQLFHIENVPFGTFPNTHDFMLGLEHLRDLDLRGRDPMEMLGDALMRFSRKHQGRWPRLSLTGPGAIFDASRIYPEFQSNAAILVASNHPEAEALRERLRRAPRCEDGFVEAEVLDELGAASYFYLAQLGWTQSDSGLDRLEYILSVDEAEREGHPWWQDQRRIPPGIDSSAIRAPRPEAASRLPLFTNPARVPQSLHIIAMVMEDRRFPTHRFVQPLLMERPHEEGATLRVLYDDGVIDEVPYGYFPNTAKVINGLEGFITGK